MNYSIPRKLCLASFSLDTVLVSVFVAFETIISRFSSHAVWNAADSSSFFEGSLRKLLEDENEWLNKFGSDEDRKTA